MHAYDLQQYCKNHTPAEAQALMEAVRKLQSQLGSRAAEALFVKTVGVYPIETRNESYYADMVNFSLASLMAYAGDDAAASDILAKTEILPSPTRNWMLPEHTQLALETFPRYLAARERGIPYVLLTSLPKSASLSLTSTLCELMDIPYFCVSLGHFPNHALIERWLNHLASGGMTTHEHFAATPHTIRTLKKIGFDRINVQTRDPRASLWSMANMELDQKTFHDAPTAVNTLFEEYYPACISWIQDWIDAGKNNPWLYIEWIHFPDYKRDAWAVVKRILAPHRDNLAMQPVWEKLEAAITTQTEAPKKHFHQGDDDAWRKHLSPAQQEIAWNMLTPDVIALLGLVR